MKCLSVFAALLLFSNAALATPADDAFATLADRYVRDLPEFSPVSATLIGDHSADDKLDHVDANARRRSGSKRSGSNSQSRGPIQSNATDTDGCRRDAKMASLDQVRKRADTPGGRSPKRPRDWYNAWAEGSAIRSNLFITANSQQDSTPHVAGSV